MSRLLTPVWVALLTLTTLQAQEASPKKEPKGEKSVYIVHHSNAEMLAKVLENQFHEQLEADPVMGPTSAVLLRASKPEVIQQATKLLEMLDRKPQMVAIDVYVLDIVPRKSDDPKPLALNDDFDETKLSGPTAEVLERIKDLRHKGVIGEIRKFQLTALEGEESMAQVGGDRAMVTGVSSGPGGGFGGAGPGGGRGGAGAAAERPVNRSISYRSVGTMLRVTPQISDERIALKINFDDSRNVMSDDGAVIGRDESSNPIRAPEFVQSRLSSSLAIPNGTAIHTKAVKTDAKGNDQCIIIVSARIVGSESKRKK
jgi:hypothetical protein